MSDYILSHKYHYAWFCFVGNYMVTLSLPHLFSLLLGNFLSVIPCVSNLRQNLVPAHAPMPVALLLLLLPAPPSQAWASWPCCACPPSAQLPEAPPPPTHPLLGLCFFPLCLYGGSCPSQPCCVVLGYLCVSVGYQGIQDTWPLSSEGASFKWSGQVMPKQVHK